MKQEFTRYETARILGARALQIAMDAPILLKISKEEMERIGYDSLRIAELEFEKNVLPISVYRPLPKKKLAKLETVREDKIDDDKIIQKEKEVEEEIVEKAEEMGLVQEDDVEDLGDDAAPEED